MIVDYLLFLGELLVNVLFIFLFIRLMGKKELKQATPTDFGYMVLLVSIAWDMTLEAQYNLIHSFIAMILLSLLVIGIDWITFKYKKMDKLFVGEPLQIVKGGKMDKDVMKKERMSEEELLSALRGKGVFDIKTIELGVLEIDGEVTVKLYED